VPERENLYRTLQVDPAASPLVIQAAYRVLARIFHPDVEGDDQEMKRLNHAWSILGDPRLRAEYDRQLAGRHHGPGAAHGSSAPAGPRASARAPTPSSPNPRATDAGRPSDHAGPPQGEPSGPLLTFGRYEGWTIGQVARVDPPFLEWLRRVPAGRQLKDAIDVALQRADGARRMGLRADAGPTNDRTVHAWAPGAPTRVR
jgi:curved DNA-binding protein CbpA